MDSTYQDAINGTLCSQTSGDTIPKLAVVNRSDMLLNMYLISTQRGDRLGWDSVNNTWAAGHPPIHLWDESPLWLVKNPDLGWYWLFTSADSGAFAAVCQTPASGDLSFMSHLLLEPNEIGGIPKPDKEVLIPPDSPRIVVGCGRLGGGNRVLREQYWHSLTDSYSIAPGEHKTVSNTVTSGMQSTTSDLVSVEGSISSGVQGGWGPVSASVSASLSAGSTSFQQFTATSESVSYVSEDYENTGSRPQMFLYWQLTDSIAVYEQESGLALSTIVNGMQPVVIGGPPDKPPPPTPDRSTSAR
ncbi:hypothetical protein ACFVRB_33080 [Streptomyces nojiriensis]|uniref:hypothetical protein n=1 Tax=Streptomyces nojiriensis TaxID=66374 RepID=UPI0036D8A388